MAEVSFFVAALIALLGAGGTVLLRNPFYAVLALVCHLLGLAALFLLLRAEFVAAAQVIVYAGAVMVLYVFVVAYVGGQDRAADPHHGPGMRAIAVLFAGALLVEIAIAVIGSGLSVLDEEGTGWFEGFGSPARDRRAVPDQVPARVRDRLAAAAGRGGRRGDPRAPALRARRPARAVGRRPHALGRRAGRSATRSAARSRRRRGRRSS